MEDAALIRQILEGDENAKNDFYRQYAPRLFPICVHFLGYRDPDVEDLVQETFLIAFRYLPGFEGRSSLYTWLARICVSLCYKRIKKRERLLTYIQDDLEKIALPLSETQNARAEEEDLVRRRAEALNRLSGQLSEKCREILRLRDKEGVSYAQIGKTLKIPIGTVMSQLARCRDALRKLAQSEREGGNL